MGKCDVTSCEAEVDYFPITAHAGVMHSHYATAVCQVFIFFIIHFIHVDIHLMLWKI